ncbi:MAG: BRCT domain-containing protein [Betaproteobacteria bacterium]|jgi:NAD-dependent DNA ligase|nr:BRCT domain-containing protein [Rhodocyclaceae bacterium]MCE2950252.1 BRCT domain-containing protein [Betaproteobacteria bacterium]
MNFGRTAGAARNDMARCLGALMGIAQGMLCDGRLSDDEIRFLQQWLHQNGAASREWPGNILSARVQAAMADGIITEPERAHLVETLQQMLGGRSDTLAEATRATNLGLDHDTPVVFQDAAFCLTGDFVFAPRPHCHEQILKRGGLVKTAVSRKLSYLVIGSLGSAEWSYGSFGQKVEKAMQLKAQGTRIAVISEDHWAAAL